MEPVLVGLPFENGIRMMQRFGRGVTGAIDGPKAIFSRLRNLRGVDRIMLDLSAYAFRVGLSDRNQEKAIERHNRQTLRAHDYIANFSRSLCEKNYVPVFIGGDHSLTYPLFTGCCQAHKNRRFGLIVIDAHFDMREPETLAGISGLISSGNSFRHIVEDAKLGIHPHNMATIGIYDTGSEAFRTQQSFANEYGIHVVYDRECQQGNLEQIIQNALEVATRGTDGFYLSLDIDAVEVAHAPGVSAPAAQGLSRETWLKLSKEFGRHPNLVAADLVETSSRKKGWQYLHGLPQEPALFDGDVLGKTADLASETIRNMLAGHQKKR